MFIQPRPCQSHRYLGNIMNCLDCRFDPTLRQAELLPLPRVREMRSETSQRGHTSSFASEQVMMCVQEKCRECWFCLLIHFTAGLTSFDHAGRAGGGLAISPNLLFLFLFEFLSFGTSLPASGLSLPQPSPPHRPRQ